MGKLSFMTLGCPGWDLDTICRRGEEYGYNGVDFRGYLDTIDITTLPEFTTQAEQTRRRLADAGLEVSAISSSITVCVPERRGQNLEEAKRTILTAQGLGAKVIRIFGGGDLNQYRREELIQIGLEMIEEIMELSGGDALNWVFETHDNWIKSEDAGRLVDSINHPAFGALWDIGHTARVGAETPQQTYSAIGTRVMYTHIKDAVFQPEHPLAMGDGWRYVLPGEGTLPLAEGVQLLLANGYEGWFNFEHEKRWHPELEEPEVVFPAYVRWARRVMGE